MRIVLFIVLIPIISFSQNIIIRGNVSDQRTKGIVFGAAIHLVGTQKGVTTDINGNYEIKNVSVGKHIIKCTFVGTKPQVDTIEIRGNDKVIIENFILEPDPAKKVIITKQK